MKKTKNLSKIKNWKDAVNNIHSHLANKNTPKGTPCKSKVELKGSKKDCWIITISDNYNFKGDMAITHEEAVKLRDILNKKIK